MRQLLSELSDMGGRTVESTVKYDWGECLAIHFTDGTSIIFEAKESYESAEFEIKSESPAEHNCTAYAALGIISTQDEKKIKEKSEAKVKQRRNDTRRAQYEKLKIEFGD
jgi:hypothetical protein